MEKPENRAERLKREKDGLDVIHDIHRYAQTGFQTIDPDDMDRFKWYGLYTQRPVEDGFFMLRIRVPNGMLSAEQLETIGWLSQTCARSSGDITTRQCIQLHYVRIEDVPHIFAELAKVGLNSQETCGDVVRNVVGCPLAGIAADELIDARPLVENLSQRYVNDHAYSNLPRKFKISISGCSQYCAQHEINDVGLIAVKNAGGEIGFDLRVGGGLGSRALLSQRLGAFLRFAEVPEVVTRIVEIFRDHGNREDRRKARLKFVVNAWGAEKFRAELETRLGRKLSDGPAPEIPANARRNHVGIGAQREAGLFYVGAAVLRGRISGGQMVTVAGLARRYGSGRVRLTAQQNFIILDVPAHHVAALDAALKALDLHTDATVFRRNTVSCTGREFCKLAVVETKERAAEIIRHLETAIPGFNEELRISVTGCVNSCAQYQIADIGLVGVKRQVNGEEADFFQIHLGGHFGRDAAFGRKLSKRIAVAEIKDYLEQLVRAFLAKRQPGERFYQFIARHETRQLETIELLARAEAAAV
jgi:sulfite reductase (ferredoxin)